MRAAEQLNSPQPRVTFSSDVSSEGDEPLPKFFFRILLKIKSKTSSKLIQINSSLVQINSSLVQINSN